MAYNVLFPVQIIDSQSMGASITGDVVEIKNQDNIGIQLHWTGTPTGSFDFQISNNHKQDSNGNVTVAGDWITLPVMPAITAAGSADDAYVDLNQISAMYMRVVYTRTSGTGSLNAYVSGKGI